MRTTFDGFRVRRTIAIGSRLQDGGGMRVWIGRSILAVALIHTVFGVVFLAGFLGPVVQRGLFDTIRLTVPSPAATAFWFFVAGILAFMVGGLVDHLERHGLAFPVFLPWSLLALTVAGCILMPASAWWLLLVSVYGMFVRDRRMAAGSRAGSS